jgi:hypothetical protein
MNVQDRSARRTRRGGKLTEDEVREIKRRVRAGEPQYLLAEEYRVGPTVVSLIIRGYIWQDVQ